MRTRFFNDHKDDDDHYVCFQFLHKLTARALIRDYEDGNLDANQAEHEVCVCVRPRLKTAGLGLAAQSELHLLTWIFVCPGEEGGAEVLHHQPEQRVLHPVSVHQLRGHRGKGL